MSESWQRRFQVSERTIRNDINSINDYLELQNLSSIQFGSNGLLLVEDDIEEVMTLEADNDLYSYRYQRKSERD
jgi:transcriptional antiterminator